MIVNFRVDIISCSLNCYALFSLVFVVNAMQLWATLIYSKLIMCIVDIDNITHIGNN